MSSHRQTASTLEQPQPTTVEVRCTGHIHAIVGKTGFDYDFDGRTLREFLESFFERYDVQDKLIAETEADATTRGWVGTIDDLPGQNYAKNPEGEQTRRYARVSINGTFNEHLAGLDTVLEDGDRVSLMYPFIYCC